MSKKPPASKKSKQSKSDGKGNKGKRSLFKLNKGVIESCRKLESDDKIENFMHFATLVHKINLIMLEYENLKAVYNIIDIIYSEKLIDKIIGFVTNTDYFCNFGIRLLEHL